MSAKENNAGHSKRKLIQRIFGSRAYARLFSAQAVTALGDWLGLIAISVVASQVGGGSPETAVGLVLAARLIPGFFLSQLAGVIADRMNRRKLMVICDVARAAVLLYLPFVDTVWQLIIVSFVLEIFTLLWIPAKEALMPNIVPKSRLASSNSLSLLATYGTFPLASIVLLALSPLAKTLDDVDALNIFRIDDTSIAFYADSLTFLCSALLLISMSKVLGEKIPPRTRVDLQTNKIRFYLTQALKELKEGMRYIAVTPVVRGVNIGSATALIGGGMLIPLGVVFVNDVLSAGAAGFAGMQVALGGGAGLGVAVLLFLRHRHKHISDENIFIWSTQGAGISLIVATSFNVLVGVLIGVGIMGVFAGAMYVSGFTLLHDKVSDELRGRVFSSLYALMRFSVLLALVIAPFLAGLIGGIVGAVYGDQVNIGDFTYPIPGVRLTLWLAALLMILAGVFSTKGVRQSK